MEVHRDEALLRQIGVVWFIIEASREAAQAESRSGCTGDDSQELPSLHVYLLSGCRQLGPAEAATSSIGWVRCVGSLGRECCFL